MKILKYGLLAGCMALTPFVAQAQEGAARDCRDNVADALNVGGFNVTVSPGRSGDNGSPVVEWEANVSGHKIQGFCETNRNGRVTSMQLSRSRGGRGNNNGGNDGRGNDGRGKGNNGGPAAAIFSVNVDTSGRGTLTGMGQNVRITRGWVDTRSTPSVSLSGDGDFKITFLGSVTGSGQDREFTIRINNSSRGNASGTATIKLNSARDEVESIRVEGRVGNSTVNGSFNRD